MTPAFVRLLRRDAARARAMATALRVLVTLLWHPEEVTDFARTVGDQIDQLAESLGIKP